MWASLFFIFGLIVGSFINVVILRHNTGKSLQGRSGCASCSGTLSWAELVPVLSFFLLRGRCKHCGSKISWQYPVVELIVALLFMLVYMQGFDLLYTVIALLIIAVAVVMSVYDTLHTIIPSAYVYTFIALSVLWNIEGAIIAHIIAGVILAMPFALLWLMSQGRLMGLGDAKIILGIGIFLGAWGGLTALAIASIAGSIIGGLYIAWRKLCIARLGVKSKERTIKLEIPFGPFLILGFLLVWLLHVDVWYLNLMSI